PARLIVLGSDLDLYAACESFCRAFRHSCHVSNAKMARTLIMHWILDITSSEDHSGELLFKHVSQNIHHLLGRRCPSHRCGIDFLQRVDNVLGMQSDIGLAKRSAVASVKGSIPLLVLVTEAHDNQIALLDQRLGTDGVDLG